MKQLFLSKIPDGKVTPSDFDIRDIPIPVSDGTGGFDQSKLEEGQIVVKLVAMSVDPYMRNSFKI